MAGVKGRSGRRPKPVALHLLAGTYRADRHGPRPAAAGSSALSMAHVDPLPKTLLAGLHDPGRAFVVSLWTTYGSWSVGDTVLLHQAALLVDRLSEYQKILAADGCLVPRRAGGPIEPHPLLRLQAQAQRTFVLLLDKLDLKDS